MTASILDQAMRLLSSECAGVFELLNIYTQIAFRLVSRPSDS